MSVQEIRSFMSDFCRYCYEEKNVEKMIGMVSENIQCIGTGKGEFIQGREAFSELIRKRTRNNVDKVECQIENMNIEDLKTGSWSCMTALSIHMTVSGIKMAYSIRMSAVLHREDGKWLFDSIHMSEAAGHRSRDILLFEGMEASVGDLGEVMNLLVPGGVVNCLIEDDYPVLIANTQFLKMMEYDDFQSFSQSVGGCFINAVHPDDRDKYEYHACFSGTSEKGSECEYRLRKSDGSYIWVYDIGRRLTSQNGQETLLSVLIDISLQRKEKQMLELETETDFLTRIYNRKGARHMIEKIIDENTEWIFCVADLDNFKQVNDLYGHQQGDRVLSYVAGQLNLFFGQKGIVWRLGGDEFGLFVPQYDDLEAIRNFIVAMSDNYTRILHKKCPDANSTMSVGGVYGSGRISMEYMYRQADRNLYQIKYNEKGMLLLTPFKNDAD